MNILLDTAKKVAGWLGKKKIVLTIGISTGIIILGIVLNSLFFYKTDILVESGTEKLVEIKKTDYSGKEVNYEEITLTDETKTSCAEVFKQVKSAGKINFSKGDTYTMVFYPKVTSKILDGLKLLKKADVKAISSSLKGNKTQVLKSMSIPVGNVVWEVVSAVCQSQLNNIEPQIRQLESGIDEAKTWLINELIGKLTGNFKYLLN